MKKTSKRETSYASWKGLKFKTHSNHCIITYRLQLRSLGILRASITLTENRNLFCWWNLTNCFLIVLCKNLSSFYKTVLDLSNIVTNQAIKKIRIWTFRCTNIKILVRSLWITDIMKILFFVIKSEWFHNEIFSQV